MSTSRQQVVVCALGTMDYKQAWDLQKSIQARLVQDKRSANPRAIPHVLLLVEHPPVYTLGKSGDRSNLLVDDEALAASGAEFFHIDRGGDITYHGPGQMVGYPILDLDRFYTDIHRYLRDLEEVVIKTCESHGVQTGRVEGRTGVWTRADEHGAERKISAMGIRCSRWVTMHGFAFNINTELNRYQAIIPCGISDRDVTSIQAELGRLIDEEQVRTILLEHFRQVFDVDITVLEADKADRFIEAYLEEKVIIE